jgi:hypothetical protein
VDWTRSFHGLSEQPFSKEAAEVLQRPIPPEDIEVKADGIMYLPEIKYRRILNKAFGPGGWGLAPRGETIITDKSVTREYALVAHGRFVAPLSSFPFLFLSMRVGVSLYKWLVFPVLRVVDKVDCCFTGWFPWLVVNKITFRWTTYRRLWRAASRMP